MEMIILFATGIAVLTAVVVELVKHTVKPDERWLPLTSLVTGIIIGLIVFFIPELKAEISIGAHVLGGAISGLAASGLYDLTVKPIVKED